MWIKTRTEPNWKFCANASVGPGVDEAHGLLVAGLAEEALASRPSRQLVRMLMEHDLVDELRLIVFLVVLGLGYDPSPPPAMTDY